MHDNPISATKRWHIDPDAVNEAIDVRALMSSLELCAGENRA